MSTDKAAYGLAKANAQKTKDINVINANSIYKFRALRAKQKTGNLIVGLVGVFSDSIGVGNFAENPCTQLTMDTKGWVGLLNEYYKTAVGDVGIGFKNANSAASTSHWTFSGAWSNRSDCVVEGGKQTSVNGAYAECGFNGTAVDLWFEKDPFGSATVEIYIDTVLNQTINLDLANTAKGLAFKVAITGLSAGAHVVKILNKTVNYCVVMGLHEVAGSTGISFLNLSRSGKTSSYLYDTTTVPDNLKQSLEMYAYDLVMIGFMVNDAGLSVPLSDFKLRYDAFVDEALGNGSDVVLICQRAKTTTFTGNEMQYINIMRFIAESKGVCFIDISNRWSKCVNDGNVGQYMFDSDHPNQIGHYDIFKTVLGVLES